MNASEKAMAILKAMREAALNGGVCIQDFGVMRIQYALSTERVKLRVNGRSETYDFAWRCLTRWCVANEELASRRLEGMRIG